MLGEQCLKILLGLYRETFQFLRFDIEATYNGIYCDIFNGVDKVYASYSILL